MKLTAIEKMKAEIMILKNNLASAQRENKQLKKAYLKLERRFERLASKNSPLKG